MELIRCSSSYDKFWYCFETLLAFLEILGKIFLLMAAFIVGKNKNAQGLDFLDNIYFFIDLDILSNVDLFV